MGGRGGSSGLSAGFSYKGKNGKNVTVQKTSAGVTLVNGKPSKANYSALLKGAKGQDGFSRLSSSQLAERRHKRYEDYNSHDHELLGDARGKGKTVYRPKR